jgi:hypothetical protein
VERGEIAAEDSPLRHAPHTVEDLVADWTRAYSREQGCFPPASFRVDKYWPPVGRVDNVHGDRNLICTCPPLEDYAFEPQHAFLGVHPAGKPAIGGDSPADAAQLDRSAAPVADQVGRGERARWGGEGLIEGCAVRVWPSRADAGQQGVEQGRSAVDPGVVKWCRHVAPAGSIHTLRKRGQGQGGGQRQCKHGRTGSRGSGHGSGPRGGVQTASVVRSPGLRKCGGLASSHGWNIFELLNS